MKNLEIKSVECFKDNVELVEIDNVCASNGEKFLRGYQVDILAVVTNSSSETREFNISLQSTDRKDGMMNYANASMSLSHRYGNDADESPKLAAWLEETGEDVFYDEIISICLNKSFDLSQSKYNEMINIFQMFNNKIIKLKR